MGRLEVRTRRVTHWRTSDQKMRWCAAALGAMERQFRRVKHYRQLPLLKTGSCLRTPRPKRRIHARHCLNINYNRDIPVPKVAS